MSESNAPEIWVCSICRIGLNFVETVDERGVLVPEGWLHSRPVETEHSPDPVRLADLPGGEIRTVCDICSQPDPMNLWHSSAIGGRIEAVGKNRKSIEIRDRDNAWLVCDECEPLIAEGNLIGVLKRSYANLQALYPGVPFNTEQRALIADRIRGFLDSRIAPSVRRNF